MWSHPDQVKALIEASWRYHVVAIIMSFGVAFFALEQANRARYALDSVRAQQTQVTSLLLDAGGAANRLRQFLLADYGDLPNEGAAISALIKDLRWAKKDLLSLSNTLLQANWPTIEERIAFNAPYNLLSALLYYNDGTQIIAPYIASEAALRLSEHPEGTISGGALITDLNFEDLARLTYISSVRPSMLRALRDRDLRSPMSKEGYQQLLRILNIARDEAANLYAITSRNEAAKLWTNWVIASSGTRDERQATLLKLASQRSMQDRLMELQKSAHSSEELMAGLNYFQLPFVGQNLSVAAAVWLLPLVVSVMCILSAVSIWQATVNAKSLSPDDELGGITAPFLLVYAGPGRHVSLATIVQLFTIFLPCLVILAIALLSPVVALQGGWSGAFWAITIASAMPAIALFLLVLQLNETVRCRLPSATQ